jgi:leader peptidase (prepilin peptidase)/N-methyltransferase
METTEISVLLLLAVQLAVIAMIDLRKLVIPDLCNIVLAATGLAAHWLLGSFDPVRISLGILVFAGTFSLVRFVHFRARGQIGLGLGDVKMAAAAGCWITIASFPLFLAVSSLSALAFALLTLPFWKKSARMQRVPFGPFLSAGLLLTFVFELNSISVLIV